MREEERDTHPGFGMIGAYRTSISPPGHALFASEIRHGHTVVLRIETAERIRSLNSDRYSGRERLIEVEMSEAQWASFVSSMNTAGVPCTLRQIGKERIEAVPFQPRLEHSLRETRQAADSAFAEIREAFEDYRKSPTKDNLRTLQARIENAGPNVEFAGKSLGEHAENVVEKARADVEAIMLAKAEQLGIEAPASPLLLGGGEDV